MKSEVLRVKPSIGLRSLVGIWGSAPYPWGNYFHFRDDLRVLNFWAENLEAATRFLDDGLVQIRKWTWEREGRTYSVAIIDDPRIPADWYYNKLCFTGGRLPPAEVAKEIYDLLGDPDNEYERFTDPEMYHARRNWRFNPKTGSRSSSRDHTAAQLVAELEAARNQHGALRVRESGQAAVQARSAGRSK